MREQLTRSVRDGISAIQQLEEERCLLFMEQVAECLADRFQAGSKILVAGNGGSLCDANHFAEELTGYFRQSRAALPAIALSEPGHITCVGNDLGFDSIFSRGVEALGVPGDVFVGLTTSGNSPNIVKAFKVAKGLGLHTVAFLGKDGGALRGVADHELIIEGFPTSDRIQEAHMTAIHIIIELTEYRLFPLLFAKEEQKSTPVAHG